MCLAPVPSASWRARLFAALEAEHESAYLLGLDLSLQYVNEAWRRFARQNGAPQLGSNWHTADPITRYFDGPTRVPIVACFARVIARNQPWSYLYECSSPTQYRKFNMWVVPTAPRDGLIVVHSRAVELVPGQALADQMRNYIDERGLLVQCSGCRRIHNPLEFSWDWAPWLATDQRPNTSHGMCPICDF